MRELSELVQTTERRLQGSSHRWARPLAWVLRTRLVIACPLPFRMVGLTNPLLPIIMLERKFVTRNLRLGDEGRARIMHTLLHEAAHQLWAVWPEWRNWLGDRNHYGPESNAADAIAEGVMRSMGVRSHYAERKLSYVSPLQKLGLIKG